MHSLFRAFWIAQFLLKLILVSQVSSFSFFQKSSLKKFIMLLSLLTYIKYIVKTEQMNHVHGPNCGCAEYVGAENANDLYGLIDLQKVRCLNEEQANSGAKVFRDFDTRFQKQNFVASDCDGQLLFIIPFSYQVKVRSVCVIAKGEQKYPSKLKLYVNNENVDFSIAQQTAVQQFDIPPNLSGEVHNAVKMTKFSGVHKLIMHLSNPNEEVIEVSYIQIKGENNKIQRKAVQTVYEIQPNAQKKDLKDLEKNPFQMG